MLNFQKLIRQIEEIESTAQLDGDLSQELVANALDAYDQAAANLGRFKEKLEANLLTVFWPVAKPLESMDEERKIDAGDFKHTVVAADGSQIMPSHHEIYNCYLLNAGLVIISYGVKHEVVLDSIPVLYHKASDMYTMVDRRRVHVDELQISLERYLFELETLANAANECMTRALPVVAYVDGSLIPWSLEKMPESFQVEFSARLSKVLRSLAAARIPLVGYISATRAQDVISTLRIWQCPYERSLCSELCGHLVEEKFPCSSVGTASDRQLFGRLLMQGCRSPVFLSGSSFARKLPNEQRTCFAYLNVASEIARLEFPKWVFDDKKVLDLVFRSALGQVQKGLGYPIALSEAHYLAVVKAADRAKFFELLNNRLIELGASHVSVSPKESRKRDGIL